MNNEHRAQLKSYLKSLPKNKNNEFKTVKNGLLLKFLKSEDFIEDEKTKRLVEIEFWTTQRAKNLIKLIHSIK